MTFSLINDDLATGFVLNVQSLVSLLAYPLFQQIESAYALSEKS